MGAGSMTVHGRRLRRPGISAHPESAKNEGADGQVLTELMEGEFLYYPDIANIEENTEIQFMASARNVSLIRIHETAPEGPLLGTCRIGKTKDLYRGKLKCSAGKKVNLLCDWRRCGDLVVFLSRGKRKGIHWNLYFLQ